MMTHRISVVLIAAAVCMTTGCDRRKSHRLQGYIEGDFVYVASPYAGKLEKLDVDRGSWVKSGDSLFELESIPEKAARDEAERRLVQARANLEDVKKGKRPSEIAAMESQLEQAKTASVLSEKEYKRQYELHRSGATSIQDLDRTRSVQEQDRHRVSQLEADLNTAKLGSRTDQIDAAEANVRVLEAALARADWDLSQKRQSAHQGALVFDVMYRPGEWVPAGRPVVSLLPPENTKLRTFVPEQLVATIHAGDLVRAYADGVAQPFVGKVSFISPKAEYTPPVIYSQETRAKLVFLIEVVFEPSVAAKLHPGQPMDVELGP